MIFALPFISYPFILNSNKGGKELYLAAITSLWLCLKSINFSKETVLKIYTVDLLIIIFIIYVVINYYYFSFYTIFYNELWVFLSYIMLYYLFRWSYQTVFITKNTFNSIVFLIWLYCLVESIIALVQNFNILGSANQYFSITGTFVNPNFLGIYMIIGLFFLSYIYFFIPEMKNYRRFTLISFFPMMYVLMLTESRASWISLVVGFFALIFTSSKSISFFALHKKKAAIILSTLILSFIVLLYVLYTINKDSVDGRVLIAKIALSDIGDKPLLGNGPFNFTAIYNGSKANYFNDQPRSWQEIKIADYVTTALNDYIQIAFEIGILGLVLLGIITFFNLKNINFNPNTRLALAIISAFVFLGLFTSILYNPSAMVLLIWAFSISFLFGNNKLYRYKISGPKIIRSLKVISFFISLLIIALFFLKTKSLADFKTVTEDLNQKYYYKLSSLDMLIIKDDPFVEFKLGLEKYNGEEIKEGIEMIENSVKKSKIPDANIILANIYTHENNLLRTESLLLLNSGIEPYRFEPKNNLLNFYIFTGQKDRSIKIAREIINLPAKINSTKINQYKNKARQIIGNHKI